MTQTMARLKELAARAGPPGGSATVQSRFSDDVSAELPAFVAAAEPDTIVLRRGTSGQHALGADGATQLVYVLRPMPASPAAAVARWARTADGEAAVQVAAQLSVASGIDLVLTPPGRPCASLAASLVKRGLAASAGTQPAGAIVVAPATAEGSDADVHLAVVAGTSEASDDMDQWVQALDARGGTDSGGTDKGETDSRQDSSKQDSSFTDSSYDSSQQESRQP